MTLYLVFIICISCFFTAHSHSYNAEGWRDASRYLSESIDTSKDPCQDFYGFVCGKWKEKFASEALEDEYRKAAIEVVEKITDALGKIDLNDSNLASYKKSLKIFHDQCKSKVYTDEESLIVDIYQSLDTYFVPKILVNVDGVEKNPWEINDMKHFWKYVGILQKEQAIPYILKATVVESEVGCVRKPTLSISIAGFTPRHREEPKDKFNMLLKNVVSRHHNITFSDEEIQNTTKSMIELERNLRDLPINPNDNGPGRRVNISSLSEIVPQVDWDAYFDGLLPEDLKQKWLVDNPEIIISHLDMFKQLKNIIERYDLETIYNYGYLLVILRHYEKFYQHYKIKISAPQKKPGLGEYFSKALEFQNPCLYLAFEYLSSSTARFLFDVYSTNIDEWRYNINLMAETIFSAFRYLIYSLDWVDSEDKVLLAEKVNKIKFSHVIPDWINDDEIINSKTPIFDSSLNLVANDIVTTRTLFGQMLKPLIVGTIDELPPKFALGAWYSNVDMQIQISLGMLLPPLYSDAYPLSVKYGSLGWIIAHEMLHGFDPGNIIPVPEGFSRWLKNETMKQYNRRKQCFIQQYSQYCNKDAKLCITGERSLDDNVADVEGSKVAFMAYKFAAQTMIDQPLLPGMENYTHDQLFFISSGRQWCNNLQSSTFASRAIGSHSPAQARVEIPVTNNRAFAKAFKCHVGTRHAPVKTCSLWGTFWESP